MWSFILTIFRASLWITMATLLLFFAALNNPNPCHQAGKIQLDERLEFAAAKGNMQLLRSTWSDYQTGPWSYAELQTHLGGALRAAAACGNSEIIQQLLAWGADPNSPSPIGQTPLMCAAGVNNSTTVGRRLIAAGANLNIRDHRGRTARMAAIAAHDDPLLAILSAIAR